MNYSKNFVIALLGSECFDPEQVESARFRMRIKTEESLDVFATLLFFFLFEPDFTPNKFLAYFCGIKKVTDLQNHKDDFRNALDRAFDQLANLEFRNTPFLTYQRKGNQWHYQLSPKTFEIKITCCSELEPGAFWHEGRRGVSVAYLGAYLYLLGICGQSKIDLSYLARQKIIQDFQPGYEVWQARNTIKALVKTLAVKGVFDYGKQLEALDDHILHVHPKAPPSGLKYDEVLEDVVVSRYRTTRWRNRKPVGSYFTTTDFGSIRRELEGAMNCINFWNTDIRYQGVILPPQHYLEFQYSRLQKFKRSLHPLSKLHYSKWDQITFGAQEECAILEIECLRTLYRRHLHPKKLNTDHITSRLFERLSPIQRQLTIEIGFEALDKFQKDEQRRCCFRSKYAKYTRKKATSELIDLLLGQLFESFGYPSCKRIISENSFQRICIDLFWGMAKQIDSDFLYRIGDTPRIIITEHAVIVPKDQAFLYLDVLSASYRKVLGDIRRAVFRVTIGNTIKRYKYSKSKHWQELKDTVVRPVE